MKAEELMIGDWVYYSSKKHIVQVVGISGIQYSFNQQDVILYGDCFKDFDGRGRWESHTTKSLSPIPLTPEILEKNGFEMVLDKDKLPTYRIKWTRNPNLYFTVFTGVDGYWNPVGFGVTIAGVNGVIDYVHQLQHALKLCGINKDIVL